MAPNIAPVANMMSNNVFEQIVNQSGGFGGKHHHHGSSDKDFDLNGTDPFAGSASEHHSVFLSVLSKTSEQHRMGLIVTLAFSILAALIVIYTIVHDAFRVRPGEVYSRAQKQSNIFRKLHPAEIFPFITAVAILIQAIVFLAVQATGLGNFETNGCRLTAQLIWPAYFIVLFVISTFSLETTIRALAKQRFRPRHKYTTPLCIGAVSLFLLALWLTAFFFPSLDICPASLSWWTVHYSKIGIVLVGGIGLLHLVTGAVIVFQLINTAEIDPSERIAVSRVVYAMGINIIVAALILPFWIQNVLGQFPIDSSKVSDVGITLTGMVFCAMHLFSRANAERLAIRSRKMSWTKNKKLRIFGSSDLHERTYISAPLLEPKLSVRSQDTFDHSWQRSPISEHQSPHALPPDYADPMSMPPVMPLDFTAPRGAPPHRPPHPQDFERPLPPQPAAVPQMQTISAGFTTEAHPGTPVMTAQPDPEDSPSTHQREPSENSIISAYTSGLVEPPAPLFAGNQERQYSSMSSGSIEIGLRLSRPITGMDPAQMLPSRAVSNISGLDLEKTLPSIPSSPSAEPVPDIDEQEPTFPPTSPSQDSAASAKAPAALPPKNIGIGFLGNGPKGSLKAMANLPQRTSPLSNVVKVDSPTPTEKSDPFENVGSSPQVKKSPQNLSPPVVKGLPRSPSPRGQSPTPAVQRSSPLGKAPLLQALTPLREVKARSAAGSELSTPSPRSPTEWPKWEGAGSKDWPSGDQVDVPSSDKHRWA